MALQCVEHDRYEEGGGDAGVATDTGDGETGAESDAGSDTEDEAYAILKDLLLNEKWADPAGSLTHGEQRKLELAILMALEPKVLFLDEPTAGMSQEEVPAILEVLEKIKSSGDRTILLVEHKMDMIMALSDSIAVLQDGRLIADGDADVIQRSKEVQEAYLGEEC